MHKPNIFNPADSAKRWSVDEVSMSWNPSTQRFDFIKDGFSMSVPRDMGNDFFKNFKATEVSS